MGGTLQCARKHCASTVVRYSGSLVSLIFCIHKKGKLYYITDIRHKLFWLAYRCGLWTDLGTELVHNLGTACPAKHFTNYLSSDFFSKVTFKCNFIRDRTSWKYKLNWSLICSVTENDVLFQFFISVVFRLLVHNCVHKIACTVFGLWHIWTKKKSDKDSGFVNKVTENKHECHREKWC